MKPSEIILKRSFELMAENEPFKELQKIPESESKLTMVTLIGCAIQIQSITDYLDEEWEKNQPEVDKKFNICVACKKRDGRMHTCNIYR